MPFRILTAAVFLFMLATPANCQNTDHQQNDAPDASNTSQNKSTTKLKDASAYKESAPYHHKQYCNGYSNGNVGDSVTVKEFYRKWGKSHQ